MAQYKGKDVKLNKPYPIRKGEDGYGRKQMKVYVMDGNKVRKVMFGDPNSEIKRDNPERRKAFRDRHNCDNAGPKTKARHWSCKAW